MKTAALILAVHSDNDESFRAACWTVSTKRGVEGLNSQMEIGEGVQIETEI